MANNNNGGSAEAQSWRSRFPVDSRLRIIIRIMDTLMRHLVALSCPEQVSALMRIVVSFEERIYTTAQSQNEYLRKISMKMLALENRNTGVQQIHPAPELDDYETGWQSRFPTDCRLRIFNKILDTTRRHLPLTSAKDLLEATESAVMSEKQIYASAIDQSDYLSKIAVKLLSIEVSSQNSDVTSN